MPSKTFIIIDKMPNTTKTQEAAAKSGAEMMLMNMSYWPLELAAKLGKHFGIKHKILTVAEDELEDYLARQLAPK